VLALLILSCSVAADATAVAIAASVRGITFRRGLALATSFGVAQSLMAALGWLGGSAVGNLWMQWDHWVALAMLCAVGIKMIKEAVTEEEERRPASLFMLAIATSIDALAIGISLPALRVPVAISLAMIGIVTFLLSAAGAAFGRFLGERFGRGMEIVGGIALIGIGVSIVIEHLRG
jgi:putative Mn2+ efflux pump MntP